MGWVLILYVYANALANGDSVAMTTVPNFTTQQACQVAGRQATGMTDGSAKTMRFVCVQVK